MHKITRTSLASALLLTAGLLAAPAQAQGSLSDAQVETLRDEARSAATEQNFDLALRSIEKVIIARPTDLAARFFRATLLTQMGRGEEIISELEVMIGLNIPEADKKRARDLITAIKKKGQKFSLAGKADFGLGSTDNANSWPDEGLYSQEDGSTIALTDPIYLEYTQQSDTYFDASVNLDGTYMLPGASGLNAIFGIGLSEKQGSDTVNMDSSQTKMNLGLTGADLGGFNFRLTYSTVENDRVNKTAKKNVDGQTDVNTDVDSTTLTASLNRKFGKIDAGFRFSSKEDDASQLGTADLYDATTETTSFSIGAPAGKRNYVRLALNSTDKSSDLTPTSDLTKADGEEKSNKTTDGYSFLFLRVLPKTQKIILSATMNESEFEKQTVDGKKRLDELTYLTAKYSIDGGQLWKPLGGYELGVDVISLDQSSNQKSAAVSSLSYKFSISRKFDLY